jgi:hypothetical protein
LRRSRSGRGRSVVAGPEENEGKEGNERGKEGSESVIAGEDVRMILGAEGTLEKRKARAMVNER